MKQVVLYCSHVTTVPNHEAFGTDKKFLQDKAWWCDRCQEWSNFQSIWASTYQMPHEKDAASFVRSSQIRVKLKDNSDLVDVQELLGENLYDITRVEYLVETKSMMRDEIIKEYGIDPEQWLNQHKRKTCKESEPSDPSDSTPESKTQAGES